MKSKEYKIDTFEKFFNVINEENLERIMVDFYQSAQVYLKVCNLERDKSESNKNKFNSELVGFTCFKWVDDGKIGIRTLEVSNQNTGEVVKIKNTRKRVKV